MAAPQITEITRPEEHPGRVVWTLAWPAVALSSMQVVNNLLDAYFTGQLERGAMTAHGSSVVVLFLMFSIVMALGTAATALVSRAFGEENVPGYRIACGECLSLGLILGGILTAATVALAIWAPGAFLPSSDARAIKILSQYLLLYSASIPAIAIIQVLAGSLRGIGDTKSPMVISGIQIGLHIALNYVLIFPSRPTPLGIVIPGANFGLPGAGLAFTISAWVSALVYLVYSRSTPFGSLLRIPFPTLEWAIRILRIASPAAIQGVLRVGSLAAFISVLRAVPNASDAIAAVRFGFTLESIMFMPAFGLSMAAAALVGQSLGMGRPDRAERLGWVAGHYGALVILALSVPIYAFANAIARSLVHDAGVAAEVTLVIRYLCVTEVLFGYAMVMTGAMQGAGDTVRPMWITVLSLWLLRVPLAWILALGMGFGSQGAWLAMSATQAIQGLLAIWLFRQGKWKLQKV